MIIFTPEKNIRQLHFCRWCRWHGWEGQFGSVCGSTPDLPPIFRITCLLLSSHCQTRKYIIPQHELWELSLIATSFQHKVTLVRCSGRKPPSRITKGSFLRSFVAHDSWGFEKTLGDSSRWFSKEIAKEIPRKTKFNLFHYSFWHWRIISHHLCECAILTMWCLCQSGSKMILRHRILKAQPVLAY